VKDYNDEDLELFEWLASCGVTVTETDDTEYRKLVYAAINRQDKARRFEIHNTDLIYCLKASFFYKICPQFFSEDEYDRLNHWFRGKGFELGVVNALYGLLNEEIERQKIVRLGEAIGSVDLQFQGVPYELATRLFYGSEKKPKKFPPIDKVMQNISYIIPQSKSVGKVKLYIMSPPNEEREVMQPGLSQPVTKTIRRTERTWEVKMTYNAIRFFRTTFLTRSDLLHTALMTGKWGMLPEAFFLWRCKHCSVNYKDGKITICEYMRKERALVHELWKKWVSEKEVFLKKTYMNLVKQAGTPDVFKDVYDRKPSPYELERWKEFLQFTYDAFMQDKMPKVEE